MIYYQTITPGDDDGPAAHPHDASEISGEASFITLRVNKLLAGTITGKEIIVAGGADGIIRSDGFVAGSSGWRILGDGTAELNNVTVRGNFATGTTGARIEMNAAEPGDIDLYSASKTFPALVNTSGGSLVLSAPYSTGDWFAKLTIKAGVSGSSNFFELIGKDSVSPFTENTILLGNGTSLTSPVVYSNTTASAANVFVTSAGVLQRSTSSLRYKESITSWLDTPKVRPVRYWSKLDERWMFGFIAEEIAEVLPEAAYLNNDGEVEGYDINMVVASLAARTNQLEAHLGL